MSEATKTAKGESTRRRLLSAALSLFRERGVGVTTMRDIAKRAKLSPGASYHYFPSKTSLVLAYYQWTQDEHERRFATAIDGGESTGVAARLRRAFEDKLELLVDDRKLVAALFSSMGDPDSDLALFGEGTAALRESSIELFTRAFDDTPLDPTERRLLGEVAWLAHLGVVLFFVHDKSENHSRSRELAGLTADFFGMAVQLMRLPTSKPFLARILNLIGTRGSP